MIACQALQCVLVVRFAHDSKVEVSLARPLRVAGLAWLLCWFGASFLLVADDDLHGEVTHDQKKNNYSEFHGPAFLGVSSRESLILP